MSTGRVYVRKIKINSAVGFQIAADIKRDISLYNIQSDYIFSNFLLIQTLLINFKPWIHAAIFAYKKEAIAISFIGEIVFIETVHFYWFHQCNGVLVRESSFAGG